MNKKIKIFLGILLFFISLSYLTQNSKDKQYYSFYKTALNGPLEEFGCDGGGCSIKVNDFCFKYIDFRIGSATREISPGDFIFKKANSNTVIFKVNGIQITTKSYKKLNWYTGE